MKQWVKLIAGLATALAVSAAVWEPLATTPSPPPPERKYDARIVRDEFGVPHIFGKTDADTAYGLAYAHSEDDFETLQQVLAMTRGRTGALLGADGAKIDFILGFLKARETVQRDYSKIPADVRYMLEAYAAGVNRYAMRHPEEVRLRRLFPANGADIATGFVLRSPFFFGLDNFIANLSEGKPIPIESAAPMTPLGTDPDMNGSNAFVVAPKRMTDGKTWLISNSHQPYEGQVAWYEAVVHSAEGLDMAGALFPGSPFVLLGHNRNLGWTNTVNRPDLVDVYRLVLDESGSKYRFDGKWLQLESKRIWLPVKYGPFTLPVPRTLYWSIHGPVIKNDKGMFALRYAGIDQLRMLEQYYRLTKARDWNEWSAAMNIGGIPGTNFLYADKSGRIAYIYNALFPPRKPGFDYRGIVPGDTSKSLWNGALGFDRMPKIVDPPSGFVTNANNSPFLSAGPGSELNPADYSPLLGIERRLTNRGIRSVELMAADSAITPEELLAMKFDTAYSKNSYVGEWMAKIASANVKDSTTLAQAQLLLASWDWNSDGKGAADTLAELMIRPANQSNHRNLPFPDVRKTLTEKTDYLIKHFGRLDVPLFEMQRLRRGAVDLPMDGGTDALRATSVWDNEQKDFKGRVKHGDSFIMLVNWDKSGKVSSRSVQPYGAATNRPNSPHYTDQMKLFVNKQFKPVHFERADLIANARRAYRP